MINTYVNCTSQMLYPILDLTFIYFEPNINPELRIITYKAS